MAVPTGLAAVQAALCFSPVFQFPSQPARLSPSGAAGLAELSLGFLCLIIRSPWLQMNCAKPALLIIPFPSSAVPAGGAGGGARGRGCWLSGRPGFGGAGAAAGSATPSGSAGGADSWHRSVLGDLVEVPPRPQHPQPDLFSVLRRIEKLLQVEDSSSRHCQVLPAEHRQRHSRCCSQEKQASFFFIYFYF